MEHKELVLNLVQVVIKVVTSLALSTHWIVHQCFISNYKRVITFFFFCLWHAENGLAFKQWHPNRRINRWQTTLCPLVTEIHKRELAGMWKVLSSQIFWTGIHTWIPVLCSGCRAPENIWNDTSCIYQQSAKEANISDHNVPHCVSATDILLYCRTYIMCKISALVLLMSWKSYFKFED